MTGNRNLALDVSRGSPENATNGTRFSTAERTDVNATYRILGDSMPSLEGSRGTVWHEFCRAMHGWLKEYEARRARIIDTDRPSWVAHKAFYGYWMVALFRCLCMQFQVDFAEELAAKLRVCMDRDDSIIYIGFSFGSKRPYYGLVEARARHEQWVEHLRAIRQHQIRLASNREEKWADMAANGGISKWFFLPYISCGQQIELNRLQHLEQSVIRRFPNALNRCRHHACTQRVVRSSADMDKHAHDVARQADRLLNDDSRVDTADDTGPEVTHLINNAMNICLTIAWHSSYPWSTTKSARRWDDSVVVLLDRAGNVFTEKLRAALTHSTRWPAGRGEP